MNLPLKRFAAVLLTMFVLGVAAETVYAGARRPNPQPQPPPQPNPQPAQQNTSPSVPVIGSLSSGSTIGSLSKGSTIGSLSSGSTIGSLSSGSMIGSLNSSKPSQTPVSSNSASGNKVNGGGVKPTEFKDTARELVKQSQQAEKAVKEAKKKLPQIEQEVRQQVEPMIPQIQQAAQQAAQQVKNDPAVQQIIQENPQMDEPIIITPRSVRAGNASSGARQPRSSYGAGYSGGNGNGPLIYNP